MLAAAVAVIAVAACTGPQLHIENPHRDALFLDGTAVPALEHGTLPFRYYGTVRWNALPRDEGDTIPDFTRQPTQGAVQVHAPVSPWLFPIDFPIELVRRLIVGRNDQRLVVELPEVQDQDRVGSEIPADALGALRSRAEAARTTR